MSKKADLTIDDVAAIKRHLMFKDLKQKEIAEKFNVAPSAISKIKNGHSHKDVEIDEFGNLIEEEILPENFHVPTDGSEEKKAEPIDDDTTPYRFKFVEEYFTKVGEHYEPTNRHAKRLIGSLWKSQGWLFNYENDDFMSCVMASVTETVFTFKPRGQFDWSNVFIAGTREQKTLHDNINKALRSDVNKYVNQLNDSYLVQIDGQKGWARPQVSSLDELIEVDEGSIPLVDELGSEASHFNLNDDYVGSHFLNWFAESHKELLTNEQVRFLNVMKFYQRDSDDDSYTISYSQIDDKYKPYTESSRDHHRRRIKKSVEDAYKDEVKQTLRQMKHERELEFWQSFIDLIELDDEQIDRQNELLSSWIKQRIDDDFMTSIFWQLDAKDVLNVRNAPSSGIIGVTLYKIVELIEHRVEHLNEFKNKVVRFPVKRESAEDRRKRENERIAQYLKDNDENYVRFTILNGGTVALAKGD